jgi:multicomponent Na+:H+ antiporter subunit C
MNLLLALISSVLFGTGVYMLLRRSLVKVIIGLALLSHAANLIIFTIGRNIKGKPAFIDKASSSITEPFADPLPQALILTAIVISFGAIAYAIVLYKRAYQITQTEDMDCLISTDEFKEEV